MSAHLEDYLKTGIEEIDRQHQEIIDFLARVLQWIDDRNAKPKFDEALRFLEEKVTLHFDAEERVMAEKGYPHLGYHKAQHDEFLKYFSKVSLSLQSNAEATELDRPHLSYFFNWLANHILENDRKMALYFKQRKGSSAETAAV